MDPELYSRNNSVQTNENCHIISKYLNIDTWKEGESVLEIGMGNGKFTMETFLPKLGNKIHRYVGSDISEKMVEYAERKFHQKQNPNIEFMKLDPQLNEISSSLIEQFDHVVSFNCFHFFSDARTALKNIFSMLKPGGEIIASLLEKNTEDDIFHNFSKHPRWGGYGHEKYVSTFFLSDNPQEEWKKTFIDAGFKDIKIFCEDRIVTFPDERKFDDFFLALDPALSDIPMHDKKAYIRDFLQEVKRGTAISIEQNMKTGQRSFVMQYRIMVFIASKTLT
nr:juvenile hormone acid O-methyltransferase-like [Leptinotarsa decemlineata]